MLDKHLWEIDCCPSHESLLGELAHGKRDLHCPVDFAGPGGHAKQTHHAVGCTSVQRAVLLQKERVQLEPASAVGVSRRLRTMSGNHRTHKNLNLVDHRPGLLASHNRGLTSSCGHSKQQILCTRAIAFCLRPNVKRHSMTRNVGGDTMRATMDVDASQ